MLKSILLCSPLTFELTIFCVIYAVLFREETEAPSVWAQICIQNMATLAKEATTVRRVLEPIFRFFDTGKHWSLERGLALVVLQNMQFLMEQTGAYFPMFLLSKCIELSLLSTGCQNVWHRTSVDKHCIETIRNLWLFNHSDNHKSVLHEEYYYVRFFFWSMP